MTFQRFWQRGFAMIIVLAVLALGASWFMVSRLDAMSADFVARDRAHNAAVLNQAKQALIGYVAAQAVKPNEDNPGSLPCPENPGDFNSTVGNDGKTGTACGSSLKVGRFPWRTIGTEKLVDSAGEPLWYVVSTNWGVPSAGNSAINSNSVGQITLDGVTDAVALIIAPGPAINVTTGSGCAAWSQARAITPPPDLRNYLECENATFPADAVFVSKGPNGSFNDQVVKITAAEILPGIEAAIANRIGREIVPALQSVYTPAAWGFAGANPVYPFAATFTDPTAASYLGTTATLLATPSRYEGLLPFNRTQGCNPATDPRCTTTLLTFAKSGFDVQTGGSGYIQTQSSCSWSGSVYVCLGEYYGPSISVTVSVNVTNVAMGLRAFDVSKVSFLAHDNCACGGIGTQTVPFTATTKLNANGSATIAVAGGMLPDIVASSWGTYANYEVRVDVAAMGDHALLSSADLTTGWFVRNEWYRLTYYGVAQGHTAAALPTAPSCTTGSTCLTVTNVTPAAAQRALLVLAGRSINGSARPSATLSNYLEFDNAASTAAPRIFERQTVSNVVAAAQKRPFNDRVVVVGSN